MSKEIWLIAFGLLVVVTPYTGLPSSWKSLVFVIVGIGVASIGFLLRGEALSRGTGRQHDHFVESSPSPADHETTKLNSLN